MLSKLLKYEFKATGRLLGFMYLLVLAAAFLVGLLIRFEDYSFDNEIGLTMFAIIYVLLVMAMLIVTLVFVIGRFYENLLKGEGYLMHTLPVPTWMHIAGKTISAVVWEIVATIVLALSVILIFAVGGGWRELVEIIFEPLAAAFREYPGLSIFVIIVAFVQIVRIILMFYMSMSIGASATRYKIFFSILTFFVLMIVLNVINLVVNAGVLTNMFTVSTNTLLVEHSADASSVFESFVWKVLIKQLILDAVYAVGFFITSNFFLKNKLNLE